jgi:glycosyltransferase involved in cell wall biosynthesis
MTGKAKQLENKKIGLLVHGFAIDQFEVIKNARVMLAPITFGAGVKGKLLDAISCDTPTVTTPIGTEGISKQAWPGIEASSIDEFVAGGVTLYTNEEKWLHSMNAGKQILRQDYNIEQNSAHFVDTIIHKYQSLQSDRQQSFMQSMLNHHQFQTSKYMSQWIEAKNKLLT